MSRVCQNRSLLQALLRQISVLIKGDFLILEIIKYSPLSSWYRRQCPDEKCPYFRYPLRTIPAYISICICKKIVSGYDECVLLLVVKPH